MKFGFPLVTQIEHGMRGFYRIGHDEYHNGVGISSTKIKKALVSYAAYVQEDTFDSAALAFGRAFHAALLEPELFAATYVVAKDIPGNKNSNAYKAEFAAWGESVAGKEIISIEDAAAIAQMIETIKAHSEYGQIGPANSEVMAITTCKETGFHIKCKIDLFSASITDFKSTSSGLSPADVINDMVKWKYHVSAAFYQDIVYDLTGERLPFRVIPVTKKAPFDCEFYQLSDELLEEGRKLYKAGLKRIARWASAPESRTTKTMRTLYPSARVVYNTKDVLDFIEVT